MAQIARSGHAESNARITERRPEFNGGWRAVYPAGVETLAQSRRPIKTQSCVRRRSAMLIASQMPNPVNATVKISAAIFVSMRW